MLRFISRRLLAAVPVIAGVIIITFLLSHVIPGDPARAVAGEEATPDVIARVRQTMGLDKPLWRQFIDYVGLLLRGNLGTAWHNGHPVLNDLLSRFPATIELSLTAVMFAVIIAIPLGIVAAVFRDTPIDHIARVLGLVGASIPIFWLGLEVIYVFYGILGVEPAPLGQISELANPPTHITGLFILDSLLSGDTVAFKASLSLLFWPALCLSLGPLAVVSRMMRASMLDVVGQDYVRTARAKGLSPQVVIGKHALKNALGPVITMIGLQIGFLLGGAVLTETIFSWPGVGSYITQSILANDFAPVQAVTLLSAFFFVIINLIVDILQGVVDPRVRSV